MHALRTLVVLIVILCVVVLLQTRYQKPLSTQKVPVHVTPTAALAYPTITITMKPHTTNNADTLSAFRYPGAMMINQSEGALTLQTTDDPNTVTNWYQEAIQQQGMHTTSFVRTQANEVIHNKLVGSSNSGQITVEITRTGQGKTTITISPT